MIFQPHKQYRIRWRQLIVEELGGRRGHIFCRFFTGWRVEADRIGREIERITAFEAAVHLGQRIWRAIWPGFFVGGQIRE